MAVTTTSVLSNNVATVLSKAVEFAFAPKLQFTKAIIDSGLEHENGRDGQAGSPVKFTIYNRINPNSDTLGESSSGTPQSIGNSQKSVTLLEKGDFVTTTEKLKVLSFDNLDLTVAKLVGEHAAESTEKYAMEVAETQTGANYVTYVGVASKGLIAATNKLTSAVVRQTYTKLDRNNVPKIQTENGAFYLWFAHPDVIYDLRAETGNGAWTEFSLYGAVDERITGEIGAYEGFRFISTTAVKTDYVGGEEKQAATTVDGAHTAGATTLALTSATGIAAGNVINVNDGTNDWALEVTAVATNDLTINKAIRKNGFTYYAADGSGLPVALAGGEAAEESSVVYSNYAFGQQAFGYAYAVKPEIRVSEDPTDAYGRLARVAWYANHAIGELRPEALHKVYCSSSINPNS